jgi:hypothetical protein
MILIIGAYDEKIWKLIGKEIFEEYTISNPDEQQRSNHPTGDIGNTTTGIGNKLPDLP